MILATGGADRREAQEEVEAQPIEQVEADAQEAVTVQQYVPAPRNIEASAYLISHSSRHSGSGGETNGKRNLHGRRHLSEIVAWKETLRHSKLLRPASTGIQKIDG